MSRSVLLVIGLALIAGALLRRHQLLRRRRQEVEAGLRSEDPGRRREVMQAVAGVGLRPFASELLGRVAELPPDDPCVLELAELVARCQWEPGDDPRVVQLRFWANAVRRTGGGVTWSGPPTPAPASAPVPAHATASAATSTATATTIPAALLVLDELRRRPLPASVRPTSPEVTVASPHLSFEETDLLAVLEAELGVTVLRARFTPVDLHALVDS